MLISNLWKQTIVFDDKASSWIFRIGLEQLWLNISAPKTSFYTHFISLIIARPNISLSTHWESIVGRARTSPQVELSKLNTLKKWKPVTARNIQNQTRAQLMSKCSLQESNKPGTAQVGAPLKVLKILVGAFRRKGPTIAEPFSKTSELTNFYKRLYAYNSNLVTSNCHLAQRLTRISENVWDEV